MHRTISCLGTFRSGTTAVMRMFNTHPQVSIPHPDPKIDLWEPSFWKKAGMIIAGRKIEKHDRLLQETMQTMLPDYSYRTPQSLGDSFGMWNKVVEYYGPIVFEKSPNTISSQPGLDLLQAYIETGHDVRLFALVRDPRDVIASQQRIKISHKKPPERDRQWVEAYANLEAFRDAIGPEQCPIIRYEDLCRDPDTWAAKILTHCDLEPLPSTYAHFHERAIGRYHQTTVPSIEGWQPSEELKSAAARYGYDITPPTLFQRVLRRLLP